jgi:Cytochrome P460
MGGAALATAGALALVVAGAAVALTPEAQRRDGLPAYVTGHSAWPKLNARPIAGGSSAHGGTKNVYASKRRRGARFPVGTIIVKTARPPGKRWLSLVATMRRLEGTTNGGWRWEEFTRSSSDARFTRVAFPQSGCAACHAQARASDYVFTRR